MFKTVLLFVLGTVVGYGLNGLLSHNAHQEELTNAFEHGKAYGRMQHNKDNEDIN